MTPFWDSEFESEHLWEHAIFDEWAEALWTAFSLKRADRAREIRGDRTFKGFHRNLHSYSVEWGRVQACEALLPGLSDLRFCGPELDSLSMSKWAAVEANEQAAELIARGEIEWG